ncbi:MAG: response regulator [Chitinivibrionales bacterium]|nr:response regulator [Chitinivibrionales bacterium]
MASVQDQRVLLIFSVDVPLKSAVKGSFVSKGYRILEASSHKEVIGILENEPVDVILLDIEKMTRQELDVVHYARTKLSNAEIIILATINDLEDATNALRNGASFYLIKPVSIEDLHSIVDKVSFRLTRQEEHIGLEQRFLADLMAGSEAMEKMLKLAIKIAPTSSSVLIGGETGTGKEFFARIIHRMSHRVDGHFVAMNCGSVPETLFENELFGHKKGAFTGADRDKPGLVEEAHMGTLFLDEVGELTPQAQVKLLRFLQEKTFRRIGETSLRSVDVRIIAATNKNLQELIGRGTFREDLYYRLNVFSLYLPPLRERKNTIPNLIKLFVHRYNELTGKHITKISKTAEVLLANYDYPGNIRELENIIEHAVVLAETDEITEHDLPEHLSKNRLLLTAPQKPAAQSDIATLKDVEKQHISNALELFKGNYTETAKALGVSRSTLWRKIKEYGLGTENETE